MENWSGLKAAEKAQIIQFAINNGISDINTIRDTYNIYARTYAQGGKIHIDPSKRGTFTAAASKHGKSVQAFAAQVLAHKENYSPAMVKKANFARNAAHWHGDGGNNYGYKQAISDFHTLLNSEGKYQQEVDIISDAFFDFVASKVAEHKSSPLLKHYTENLLHQSSSGQREPQDLIRAIVSSKSKFGQHYTGGAYERGTPVDAQHWDNSKRDLVHLFIQGAPRYRSSIKELTGEDARGFDYTAFIADTYPGKSIKTYEGIFPIKGTINVSPKTYALAKFLGKNYSNVGYYLNDAYEDSDNVGTYRTHYQLYNGKPELVQTDLWDFGGDYAKQWGRDDYNSNTRRFKQLQGRLLSEVGTPFILKSINPIVIGNGNNNESFESIIAQQANALNIVSIDKDGTYNTLLSLPELNVESYYGNYMNEFGEHVPTLTLTENKKSTGGPLYPFSFQKNPYWKTPAVRYDDGGDMFIPNENIQNVQMWLNKGTRFQKQRPGTVNMQDITDKLNPFGADNQYVWDDAEHNNYSAFRRNPDYRESVIPRVETNISQLSVNPVTVPRINVSIPKPSLPKKRETNLNWVPEEIAFNPAFGYETFHLENSPYYGIKYYSIPGAANAGEGSYAVLDSTVMGIPIQELNNRIFDYRTKNGGWNSFSTPN